MDLKKLIKEVLYGDCCKAIKPTKAPILNENLAPREILSEGLKYHIDNKKPLTEHVYRAGSSNYFNLWAEARSLYVRGILDFSGDDLAILTETHLGEFGIIYEIEVGDKVKASKEYGGLSGEVVDIKGSFVIVKTKEGNQSYHESDLKVLNKEGKKVPLDFIMEEEESFPFEYKGFKYNVEVLSNITNDRGQKLYKISIDGVGSYNEYTNERDAHIDAKREIDDQLMFETKSDIMEEELEIGDIITINPDSFPSFEFPYGTKGEIIDINKADYASDDLVYTVKIKYIDGQGDEDNTLYIEKSYQYLNESKKAKKKNPPLNKPKRGGSKKFYVYVKAPGGKIKKVSFGDTSGLSAKINNPEARRAFAKRHDCANKKDKTKASYWSCRLPSYAKLLGLKSNFTGFW